MPVKPKKPKVTPSTRISFYPRQEDLETLQRARAEMQALTPNSHVSLSDAIRHAIRCLKDSPEIS